ncbi:TetR/AcrR family transcriptional regulator [Roseibium aggregatum]|uniref:WHG domain-containing protein n=1 Tax=Roseibium aggregatum TaxID=187304 RepID=A0A939EBD5_9HYPH|nr:WHG domain-containing protein [Roseibium aggregatum]MBN9668963.1 WHG domain-containing protein [Roseibium aggregatum]
MTLSTLLEEIRLADAKYHHGNLKEALISAGLEILKNEGLEALSLRACAARVGVSHGAPKNHFANLSVLQAAIVAEGFRQFAAAMRTRMADASSQGKAQVMAAARGYVGFAEDNPDLFRLMFSMERQFDIYPDLLPASQEAYAVLRDVSRYISPETCRHPVHRTSVETTLWSFLHGYASLKANRQFYTSNRETGKDPELEDVFPRFEFVEPDDG